MDDRANANRDEEYHRNAIQDMPAEIGGYDAPPSIAASRKALAEALAAGNWRTTPPPFDELVGGIRVLRFACAGEARGMVLHFHGGGYRMGCPEIVGPYAAALAERCGVDVVCPAYRLAPEYPFPAGLNDALTVLEALATADRGPLILSGDSAGGGLATSLAVLAAERHIGFAGLILLSAWLDLTVSSTSYATNAASDPLFSRESATLAAQLYLQGGVSPEHRLASPLFGKFEDFPPTLVSVGVGEVLFDDAVTMQARLHDMGCVAEFVPVAGMTHIAVVRGLTQPGAAETFERVTAFVDRIIGA